MASAISGSPRPMYLCQWASSKIWHWISSAVDSGSTERMGMPCSWLVRTFRQYNSRYDTKSMVFSPGGHLLAILSERAGPVVHDVATGRGVADFSGRETLVFDPGGRVAAVTGPDGVVRLWDTGTWKCHHALVGNAARVGTPVFSPDGAQLFTPGSGTALVWDILTGECVGERTGYPDSAAATAWHSDGYLLVAAMEGKTAPIWVG
jgi:WD40 repeat protein